MVKTAAILAAVFVLYGCGGWTPEVTAPPDTPSHAVQCFIKAIMEGDVATYFNSMDIKTRKKVAPAAMAAGPNFEPMMKQQIASFKSQWEGTRITGEKITGDTAVVTLTGPDGTTVDMDLVKESTGWKIKLMK
jgi:hypothetical protein